VAARGTVDLNTSAIEAIMGAAPGSSTSNARLVILGTTDSLRVQNFVKQPNGMWLEYSGGQDDFTAVGGTYR
jgi:hypothetical protein